MTDTSASTVEMLQDAHDDYVPSVEELGSIVDALEEGFGASLAHYPIERDDNDE